MSYGSGHMVALLTAFPVNPRRSTAEIHLAIAILDYSSEISWCIMSQSYLAELEVASITNRIGWRIELECVAPSLDISPCASLLGTS